MITQYPALIVVVPLLAAFLTTIAGWVDKRYCLPLACGAIGSCTVLALIMLAKVIGQGPIDYQLAGWPPPIGIAYRVDHLSGLVLVVVAAVAFVNLLGSAAGVKKQFAQRLGSFYTLYLLFVTGLLGVVITGDAFNLFVLLEITAITGYALIGMGSERAPLASLNYIFLGTMGASFYLLSVGYLYIATGSLNMADIAQILPKLYSSRVVLSAFLICMIGLFMKMALFPLHIWLPNAYSEAPSAVAGLIAPLTTKVMIYVMVRVALYIFTPAFAFTAINMGPVFVWLAVIAIVMGSLLALVQKRLKRILAYVIIAEVGYMVGGFWLGNQAGVTGAILHIVNDAAMTLCLFLTLGNLDFRGIDDSFEGLKGVFRKMPYSMAAFAIGAMAIIGVPPTCGFFSKWYLITGGLAAGHYGFVAALIFSSLVNVILFFKIIEIAYFEPFADHHHGGHHGPAAVAYQEAPWTMVVPLLVVAAGLILLGLFSGGLVNQIIHFALPAGIT